MDADAQNKVASLEQALSSALQRIHGLEQENKLLAQKLQLFLKRYFGGQKNEAIDPAQLELLLAGLEASAASAASAGQLTLEKAPTHQARHKAVRQKLPAHLPEERIVLEPPEVQREPHLYKKIGQEVTEELDWKPAQFIKRLYIRPKYVRQEQKKAAAIVTQAIAEVFADEQPGVLIAPLPSRLIEKGFPGPGLLAQVVISKYEDHLPLYRQEKIYWERHGVKLSRATLAEWVEQAAQWLKPIYEAIKKGLLSGKYLQADETPIRYLDADLPGKSHTGYLWTYSRPGAGVIFDWNTSRGQEGPAEFLRSFAGRLQADGYAVYQNIAHRPESKIILLGCMAHCRRKFHEAIEDDRRAAWFVRQLGHLYAVEKVLRQSRAGPALREAHRCSQAKPILQRLERAMERLKSKVLPKSRLGEAISYAQEQWTYLCRYIQYGDAEIDNNLVENAIRPTAVGKKNFLFIGHPDAGWRSAVIYSVIASCRRAGVDPFAYLKDIFRRLPEMKISQIETVTPAAWAKARKQSLPKS